MPIAKRAAMWCPTCAASSATRSCGFSKECGWNKAQAAKRLGLTRTQLYGRMNKYGIELDSAALGSVGTDPVAATNRRDREDTT